MQHSVLLRFAVPALALVASFALASDEIVFQPKPNTEAAKKLTVELDAQLVELEFKLNGESVPAEAFGDLGERAMSLRMLVGVTEKYVASDGGRPVELLRTYDEMSL